MPNLSGMSLVLVEIRIRGFHTPKGASGLKSKPSGGVEGAALQLSTSFGSGQFPIWNGSGLDWHCDPTGVAGALTSKSVPPPSKHGEQDRGAASSEGAEEHWPAAMTRPSCFQF